jgi:hypothetical protein
MSERTLDRLLPCFAAYKDQLVAHGIILGDPDSAAKAFTDLEARLMALVEVVVLSRAVKDLMISIDRFATQIPTLEDKVKHPEDKVEDGVKEIWTREPCLECTTRANNDYKKHNTRLTKKLESESFGCF